MRRQIARCSRRNVVRRPVTSATGARRLLGAKEVDEILERLAGEILAEGRAEDLVIVGIRRRGVELADRIARIIRERSGAPVPSGSLDITLYRDDFAQVGPRPVIGSTEMPGEITGRRVIIVDDVLYTGRTIRAALDELGDFGRPRRIELCVLVDRGGRELPIQPDHIGLRADIEADEQVAVRVPELDGELAVEVVAGPPGGATGRDV